MPGTFEKRDNNPQVDLTGEAAGLRWLGEAERDGGLVCSHVVHADAHRLIEERIEEGVPTREKACLAGAALARTHAAGAAWYGCPPPAWNGRGYAIGRSRTPVVPSGTVGDMGWGAACAEWRVMPHVRTICNDGLVDASEVRLLTHVADRMAAGDFDSPEPELVRSEGHACSRIHGDLWAGNLLWAADDSRAAVTGAALIDPMASGGHAETDLAMLQLFGCAYLDDLLAAYNEVSPLADGWRERIGIHQLVPALLHCVLFGESYMGLALSIARRYA
ncbi:fructosamine kinase family protein [Olsenella sp. Marseille-P4559]|jgi:fructosamine-3-kinase|uniref:fructosamine kinase family protein n=1 Tax=Olsenella sp. Marseille-P4559 TaxID=2364795 RepID=UPI001030AF10|nr:fructosamine kinase family protein [Olsenella sp. Marseille-P4559]